MPYHCRGEGTVRRLAPLGERSAMHAEKYWSRERKRLALGASAWYAISRAWNEEDEHMATAPGPEDLNQIIAGNLRELRKDRGMTLDDVAEATGVSKSMLGQIERGDCGLSVATLWKITNGLKISFTALMTENRPRAQIVNNKALTPLTNGRPGFRLYPVFPTEPGRDFEILYIELDPDTESQSEPHEPGTEEYTLVYAGTLTLSVNGEVFQVPAGHSIRYNADCPHSYVNQGAEMVKLCMNIRYAM